MSDAINPAAPAAAAPMPSHPSGLWDHLKLPRYVSTTKNIKNANEIVQNELSPLDRFATNLTDKVGSMPFFLAIFIWTVIWCGYNLLASEVPSLHWKSFDPFPAFVAYLLISNVIQICLMPLIMVGQNVQSRHDEVRADLDFETNKIAEQKVTLILKHLEHQTDLLLKLMQHVDCRLSEVEMMAIKAEHTLAESVAAVEPGTKAV